MGGDYPVERQKLIYAGIVLSDDRSLASYNVDENKFIVVMLTHPGTGTSPAQAELNNTVVNENNVAENVVNEVQPANQMLGEPSAGVESTFVTGEEYNRSLEVLMEMGFSRESVEGAMAAGFNNPQRAFEYLVNGIPENPENEPNENVGTNAVRAVLDLLRQNPVLLRATLEQIGITDPALIQHVVENPDAFFDLVNQSIENTSNTSPQGQGPVNQEAIAQLVGSLAGVAQGLNNNSRSQANAGNVNSNGVTGQSDLLNPPTVPLSHSDQAAIERIKAMGFSEFLVLQAYIACEKNEELTVDFLLSNNDE